MLQKAKITGFCKILRILKKPSCMRLILLFGCRRAISGMREEFPRRYTQLYSYIAILNYTGIQLYSTLPNQYNCSVLLCYTVHYRVIYCTAKTNRASSTLLYTVVQRSNQYRAVCTEMYHCYNICVAVHNIYHTILTVFTTPYKYHIYHTILTVFATLCAP